MITYACNCTLQMPFVTNKNRNRYLAGNNGHAPYANLNTIYGTGTRAFVFFPAKTKCSNRTINKTH